MAICKSLLDDQVLPLHEALFCEASTENIEVGAPRTRATDLQPAHARYAGSALRLERGRYGEQGYAESKERHPDPQTRPIHLHWHGLRCRPHPTTALRPVLKSNLNCSES